MERLKIDAVIFDQDGTVFLGDQAIPGAPETIAWLREQGKKVIFVTNKPLYPREHYAAKLNSLGIPADPEHIATSGHVTAYYLSQKHANASVYVVGEANLKTEIAAYGIKVVPEFSEQDPMEVIEPHDVDIVVVAFDRTLDYRKLNTAYQAIINGALFFATNPDKTCPMPGGGIPDAGGTIVALEHMTGRSVDVLVGKPSPVMVEVAMDMLGLPANRCLMVGDRLETDIKMGKEAGMYAASVLTGASTRAEARAAVPAPDLILDSIADLPDWIM